MRRKKRLNLLLFGMAGSSKSSFINSCFSLLSYELITQLAPSGGSTERVTRCLKPYRLTSDIHTPSETGLKLAVYDTWGLESNVDLYAEGQFELILNGQLPAEWKMGASVTGAELQQGNEDKAIHCLIVFVPAGELASPPGGKASFMVSKTKEFCATATKMKVPFLVLLTKVDQLLPAFRQNPFNTYPEIEKMKIQAATQFGIAQNQVHPLINYYGETSKVFVIDRQIYKIIEIAINIAKNVRLTDRSKSIVMNDDWS